MAVKVRVFPNQASALAASCQLCEVAVNIINGRGEHTQQKESSDILYRAMSRVIPG